MGRFLPILTILIIVWIVGSSGGGVNPQTIQGRVNAIADSIDNYQPLSPPPDLTPQYNPFDEILNGAPATPQPGRFNNPSLSPDDYAIALARDMQRQLRTTPTASNFERDVYAMADYALEQAINEAQGRNHQYAMPPATPPQDHGFMVMPNAYLSCADIGCVVNVRSGPDTRSRKLCEGSNGFGVTVNGQYGQWLSVTSNSGCNGWVRNDLISEHTNY